MRKAVFIIICIFALQNLYGQELSKYGALNKLEFRKGIPNELRSALKVVSKDNCSYSEIELTVPKDTLYIIIYDLPDGNRKYYRIRKSALEDVIRFDFYLDNRKTKIIEYDEDECYDYYIVLTKNEKDIYYSVENLKKRFELGFFWDMGFNTLTNESLIDQKHPDSKRTIITHSAFNGLAISSKYMLNKDEKLEFRFGTSNFVDVNWGMDIGLFFHQKLVQNIYVAAGTSFLIESKNPFRKANLKDFHLTYVLPTISFVYYCNKRTYITHSLFLNASDKLEYRIKEFKWGYKFGLGINL